MMSSRRSYVDHERRCVSVSMLPTFQSASDADPEQILGNATPEPSSWPLFLWPPNVVVASDPWMRRLGSSSGQTVRSSQRALLRLGGPSIAERWEQAPESSGSSPIKTSSFGSRAGLSSVSH